jgi:hypothetical protein
MTGLFSNFTWIMHRFCKDHKFSGPVDPNLESKPGLNHGKIPKCGHTVWGQTLQNIVNMAEVRQPANGSKTKRYT